MNRLILTSLAAVLVSGASLAKQPEVLKNDLRAPAYPLVTIDPYTSAWSMYDNLYDGPVAHWTSKEFPFTGVIKVDGVPYRFMGTEVFDMKPFIPTSIEGNGWRGRWTTEKPAGNWTSPDYDDSAWNWDVAAFGTKENEPTARTQWGTREIWVRRVVDIPANLDEDMPVFLDFSNDDGAIFYINGVQIHETGPFCYQNKTVKFNDEARAALHPGKNLIAAYCINTGGNALLDFGLKLPTEKKHTLDNTALQTSADVQATQTHYTFTCGPVDLALSFAAPMFLDGDLDLLSRPVNYVNYTATSNDGKAHDIEVYFDASPRWALGQPHQASESQAYEKDGMVYLSAGSRDQDVLAKAGDHVRIDWGHFYLVSPKVKGLEYGVGDPSQLRKNFVAGKSVAIAREGKDEKGDMALVRKFGKVKNADGHVLVGYNDGHSIQYFGQNLRPYWNRKGDVTIESQFQKAEKERKQLIAKCYAFDRQLMNDGIRAGGKKYAELLALAYRQAIAAHKLVEGPDGELFLFSKENDSNGSIGTVDITYPTAPLFLYYNPELAKATMNFIYDYSESGRWKKPFAAHDVGTYPKANGQTYGGDMPVEESGNMIITTYAVCKLQNNYDYARKHWDTMSTWVNYLVDYGLDPENQLCTDDFAGHFAHNVNLSAKAIEGIASYAAMARELGKTDIADKYMAIARNYASQWKQNAADGDHYRLTFDKPGTWSQKYNIVWDEMLGLNVFDPQIMDDEIKFYLSKQMEYGLPLDSRRNYTKTDWILWTASMADTNADFMAFVDPIHKFYNETKDRVPMSDWTWADKPNRSGFMARAVVGGLFMKLLVDKMNTDGQMAAND